MCFMWTNKEKLIPHSSWKEGIVLWDWCIHANIYLIALHLAGKDNSLVNQLSRDERELQEWSLNTSVAETDVSSETHNIKCLEVVLESRSRQPIPFKCIPAPLGSRPPLHFAPISSNPKRRTKDKHYSAMVILFAPAWARQQWFPDLRYLSSGVYGSLPVTADRFLGGQPALTFRPTVPTL